MIVLPFNEYIINYSSLFSIKKDFIRTLYKLFANSSGANLGNFILFLHNENLKNKKMEDLDKFLSGGV